MTPARLFEEIVAGVPAFAAVRNHHLDTYGELLPHVLLGDLARFVTSAFANGDHGSVGRASLDDVKAILAVLERGITEGDDATINAIEASFLENVEFDSSIGQLEPLMGRRTLDDLRRMRGSRSV